MAAAEETREGVKSDDPLAATAVRLTRASALVRLTGDMTRAIQRKGLSYQAIADLLDLPINRVRTRILRARRSLRERKEAWR